MWMVYTIYKNSNLATAMSVIGMIMVVLGFTMATQNMVVAGIIVAAIGGVLAIGARFVSNAKKKKDLSALTNHEYDERFKKDVNFCADFYGKYPSQKIAEYIMLLNPASAELFLKKQAKNNTRSNNKKKQPEATEKNRHMKTNDSFVAVVNTISGNQSEANSFNQLGLIKPTGSYHINSQAGNTTSDNKTLVENTKPKTAIITSEYLKISKPIDKVINIGRDSSFCDIVFPADTPGVSRRHCAVTATPESKVFVMDLGSSAGTFLPDGRKLVPNEWTDFDNEFYLASKTYLFTVQ